MVIEFWVHTSFNTWEMCHLLLAPMDFDKKTCCHSNCLSPINIASFLFCYFQEFFSLLLVFKHLTVMWPGIEFGGWWYSGSSVSWICKLMFFGQTFRKLRKIFSHYFFECFLISVLFPRFWSHNTKIFYIAPKGPDSMFIFFYFYLCCSDWVISIVLFSSPWILSVLLQFYYWANPLNFLFEHTVFYI